MWEQAWGEISELITAFLVFYNKNFTHRVILSRSKQSFIENKHETTNSQREKQTFVYKQPLRVFQP